MIVKHPSLEGVTYDVPSAAVKRWKAQGWLVDKPKRVDAEPKSDEKD